MKWKGILFAVIIAVYRCHVTNAQEPSEDTDSFPNYVTEEEMQPIPTTTESAAEAPTTTTTEDADADECWTTSDCGANEECLKTLGDMKCVCRMGYMPNYNGYCEVLGTEEEMQPIPTTTESAAEAPTTTTTEDAGFDECWTSSECGVNEGCLTIQGVRKCVCNAGYHGLYGDCEAITHSGEEALVPLTTTTEVPLTTTTEAPDADMNECWTSSDCGAHEACLTIQGDFKCLCRMGYIRGDHGYCEVIPVAVTTTESAVSPVPATTTIKHADFMNEIMEVVNKYYIPRPHTHFRGYEYIYKKQRMTFNQAKNYCARKGGHVAYVNMKTQNQRKKIFNMFPGITKNPTWVGALFLHRMWFYINFQPVNHATFGWNKGEPNNLRRETCVANHRSGKVHSTYCNFKRAVLCEVRI